MIPLVVAFGVLTLVAGIVILYSPRIVFGFLRDHIENPFLQLVAVGVRLLLGALLLYLAGDSGFPLTIQVIGWLSILAAVFFAVIGRGRFIRIMNFALTVPDPYCRIGGLVAAGFGGFLVYAFV